MDSGDEDLRQDAAIAGWKKKAKAARRAGRSRNLYVITLHPDVLDDARFMEANPGYIDGMPCVYVGITIHDPGDRYRQHKSGYRSSRYPRKHGVELALELMEGFACEDLSDDEKEAALADWLRDQGFAVWQH